MNKKFLFRFSANYFCMNIKNNMGMILILIICIIACGLTLFIEGKLQYSSEICNQMLAKGNDGTGIISLNYDYWETETPEIDKLCMEEGIDNIESIGYFENLILRNSDSEWYQKLLEEQSEIYEKLKGRDASNYLEVIYVQSSLQGLFNVNLSVGNFPEQYEADVWYVFLGADYTDIPVGTELTATDYFGNECKVVICGILKKNSYWLTSDSVSGDIQNIDHEILVFCAGKPQIQRAVCYFTVKDMGGFQDTCEQLENIFGKYGIKAYIVSMADIFDSSSASYKVMLDYLGELAALLVIVSAMIILCMQSVMVLQSRRDFGIWYANGAGIGDVAGIVLLNILYETIIAGIVTYSLAIAYICYSCDASAELELSINVLNWIALPKCGLRLLLIDSISLLFPIAMIARDKPANLIKQYIG